MPLAKASKRPLFRIKSMVDFIFYCFFNRSFVENVVHYFMLCGLNWMGSMIFSGFRTIEVLFACFRWRNISFEIFIPIAVYFLSIFL